MKSTISPQEYKYNIIVLKIIIRQKSKDFIEIKKKSRLFSELLTDSEKKYFSP